MTFESALIQFEELIESSSVDSLRAHFLKHRSTLLAGIGALDPEVREGRLLNAIQDYLASDACSQEIRRGLLSELMSGSFLFHRIDEGETEASLVRTSSLLLIARIVVVSLKRKEDVSDELKALENAIFLYLRKERDQRGFVGESGWIHCLAHAADLLATFAYSNSVDHLRILRDLLEYLERATEPFAAGEDKRFGKAIALLMRTCKPGEVEALLPQSFYTEREPRYLQNLSNSLAAAYVALDGSGYSSEIAMKIKSALSSH